jgi:hypothetical protein
VVHQLNKDAVGIPEVKRPGSIAMGLDGFSERDPVRLNFRCDGIDIFRSGHDESDVIHALYSTRLPPFRQLVDREIVRPRRKVNIVRIGLPLHRHPQDRTVELDRLTDVPDVEGDMAKA